MSGTVLRGTHQSDREAATRRRESVRPIGFAVAATIGVHLLSLTRQLGPDEGGFSVVARYWHQAGPYLYGPTWVDRPPGLILVFDLANHLGPFGVRVAATLVAALLVVAISAAARGLAGDRAATWAAWTAFAFSSADLFQAQRLSGELIAATCVAMAMWLLLGRNRPGWGTLLAGVAAGSAVLVKQNFVDGLAFGVVLLALRRRPHDLGSFIAGAALPLASAAVWAEGHGGVARLLYAMYGFRADAAEVMSGWSTAAPATRLLHLLIVGFATMLLPLLLRVGISQRLELRRLNPAWCAIAAAAAVEALGVIGGANFWTHYLIAFTPTIALAAGATVPSTWTRRLVAGAVVITTIASPTMAMAAMPHPESSWSVGRWIASAARPDDTIAVAFTHANVISASGLKPAYPYMWSLPTRTLDPHVERFNAALDRPDGPTWVVRWDPADSWGLDPHGRVSATLHERYQHVARICGRGIWLRANAVRPIPPIPPSSACGDGGK